MFAPKTLVAALATMASMASAAPTPAAASGLSTIFKLGTDPSTGCVLSVVSEFGLGVSSIVVLDGVKTCDKLHTKISGPAGNGTAGVDFSTFPPGAFFIQKDYLAQCEIKNNECTAEY